jgi:hypothetical protein
MSIKQTTLADASAEQALAYATTFLNLELQPTASDQEVRSAIARAQPGNEQVFYEEAAEALQGDEAVHPTQENIGQGTQGSLGRDDPKWDIVIPMIESDDNSGKSDVLVGINGRAWQIKRGARVRVPHRVKIALENALATIIRHTDTGDIDSRDALRFPFQVMSGPSADEIAAWEARTNAEFCA